MSGTIDWNPGDALVFTQVVEQGSFTAAGGMLDLPKSTVSRRVSRLEERLGVQLLLRTTRQLSLTEAGRAFYGRASVAVEALSEAEQAATAALEAPRGRLRVTAPVESSTRLFSALLAFGEAYPDVHLDLDLTNRYVNLVEESVDAAIRGGRAPEGAQTGRSLGAVEIHLVGSPGYLAQRGTPKRSRDLAQHDYVVFSPWARTSRWKLGGPRGEVALPLQGRLSVNNLEAVRRAALEGVGLALLPETHCADDVLSGRLRRVLPSLCAPGTGLWVVYSRTRFLSAKLRAFVGFMERELSGGPSKAT